MQNFKKAAKRGFSRSCRVMTLFCKSKHTEVFHEDTMTQQTERVSSNNVKQKQQ